MRLLVPIFSLFSGEARPALIWRRSIRPAVAVGFDISRPPRMVDSQTQGCFNFKLRVLVRRRRFFLLAAKLVFQLRHAVVEALQNFPRFGRHGHAVLAMVARGGAAFDGIIKFLAAGAACARALAGSAWCGHGLFNCNRFPPLFGNDAVRADGK